MKRRKIDHSVVESTEAAAAFAKLRPQFMRLDRNELLQVNLDIPWATTLVRGVAPGVQAFREEIRKKLPERERLGTVLTCCLSALHRPRSSRRRSGVRHRSAGSNGNNLRPSPPLRPSFKIKTDHLQN
jgi:hypothetical protein